MEDLFNRSEEKQIAEKLVEKTSRGESVSDELNAVPFQDRLSIAREMVAISNEKISVPDITLTVGTDLDGREHLMNMNVEGEWFGPVGGKPFFDKDTYDMILDDKAGLPLIGMPDGAQFNADTIADAEIASRAEKIRMEKKDSKLPALDLFEDLVSEQRKTFSERR